MMSGVAMAGGNTIAASEKSSTLASGDTRTLASGLSIPMDKGVDACATIVNRSEKTAVILLTLTDFEATTSSASITKGRLGVCVSRTRNR